MDLHFGDWSGYVFRWIHLITGISWIGSSFYFMWLDAALEPPKEPKPDVEGELWMTHSGGFYEVERKKIGPGKMPAKLHWFKYEALFTWITGIILLGIVYYLNAAAYLVDPAVSNLTPNEAIGLSIAALAGSWFIYDGTWEFIGKKNPGVATVISVALATAMAWVFCRYMSGRAAYIHMGALFGTWMVANVWVRILPAQQKMIDATKEGRTPDYAHSGHAKRRSVHNTYMTFPVLFMMLSNHYSHTYGHAQNFLVLMLLIAFGGFVRHVMVAKEGKGRWAIAPAAIAAAGLIVVTGNVFNSGSHDAAATTATAGTPASATLATFKQAQAVITHRCVVCHAAQPAINTFGPAPGGVKFDSPERIQSLAERIRVRVIETKTMPLANMTHITDEERAILSSWITQGARIDTN